MTLTFAEKRETEASDTIYDHAQLGDGPSKTWTSRKRSYHDLHYSTINKTKFICSYYYHHATSQLLRSLTILTNAAF